MHPIPKSAASDIPLKMGMCVESDQMLIKFYRNTDFHFNGHMDFSYFPSLVLDSRGFDRENLFTGNVVSILCSKLFTNVNKVTPYSYLYSATRVK